MEKTSYIRWDNDSVYFVVLARRNNGPWVRTGGFTLYKNNMISSASSP
jgi:hypothetical protein